MDKKLTKNDRYFSFAKGQKELTIKRDFQVTSHTHTMWVQGTVTLLIPLLLQVKHYAGIVTYSVKNFLEKNKVGHIVTAHAHVGPALLLVPTCTCSRGPCLTPCAHLHMLTWALPYSLCPPAHAHVGPVLLLVPTCTCSHVPYLTHLFAGHPVPGL